MDSEQFDFQEKLNIAKSNYFKGLNEKYNFLITVKDCIFSAENLKEENSIAALQEAYGHIHKISGSSAMFGLNKLSKTSNKLELSLIELIKNDYSTDKKIILQNFENLLSEIKKAMAEQAV